MDRTEAAVARERALIGSSMKIRFYPLVVAGGEGVHLIDPDGRRYLDFIASGGVAQTLVTGMAELAVGGPFAEADLSDQTRFDPVHTAARQLAPVERRAVALQAGQGLMQLAQHAVGESGPDLPGVDQLAVGVVVAK